MSALFFPRLLKMVLRTIVTLMEVAKALLISSVDFTIFIQTFGEKRATTAGGMQSGPRAGQTLKRFVAVQFVVPSPSCCSPEGCFSHVPLFKTLAPPTSRCKGVLDMPRMPFPRDFLPCHRGNNQHQRPVGEMPFSARFGVTTSCLIMGLVRH